ncbi:MAG: hypothetical protein FWF28_11090, partial [Micrococcales bacterium]|nr:hypothetical protein [Micrococcales bacterium]
MNERLVVAVDGGNSKTDLILATVGGDVLAQVRGPGTHAPDGRYVEMADRLADLATQARHEAGLDDSAVVELGVFFCANVDTPDQVQALREALHRRGVCREMVIGNDTLAVLHAGAPEGWGIAVVTGAGINALACDRDGRSETFLAIGRCSGDFGGGGWVASEGQAAAIRDADGRGPGTSLRYTIPEHFGLADPFEVALAIDNGEIPWEQELTACPVVYQAADAGDAVAIGIIATQADEVATMAAALANRLAMDDAVIPVVLGGGVMTHSGLLNQRLVTEALARRL